MARTYSGKQVVKILTIKFGFSFVSQKGSHVKLRKTKGSKVITTVVPLHRELASGTLRGILDLAEIDNKEFKKSKVPSAELSSTIKIEILGNNSKMAGISFSKFFLSLRVGMRMSDSCSIFIK